PDPRHTPEHVGGAECRGAEVSGSARGDPRWSGSGGGGAALRRVAPGGAPVAPVVRGPGPPRPGGSVPPSPQVFASDGPRRGGVGAGGPPGSPGVGSTAADP